MSKYYLGIDLGSTTSKAIIINEKDEIIGRGITNTRANYKVAADIAKQEAIYDARFCLLKIILETEVIAQPIYEKYLRDIESAFQFLQFRRRLNQLLKQLKITVESSDIFKDKILFTETIQKIFLYIEPIIRDEYIFGDLGSKSQFFRDVVNDK